jgi:hypothetical protein
MTDRKIEFVNNTASIWDLVELGISVPASSSIDVTETFRDFEIIGAIQRGLKDRFTTNRYIKINGTAISTALAAKWGNCATEAGWPYLNADGVLPEKFLPGWQPCNAKDTAGGQSITGTPITLTLGAIQADSDYFELVGGNTLRVKKDGSYWISYFVTYTGGGGNKVGASGAWIEEDQGAGVWQQIQESYSASFHDEGAGESGHGTACAYQLSAGDKVRVQVKRTNGTSAITTVANKSHISLLRIAPS